MDSEHFDEVLQERISSIRSVLGKKAEEYATEDRLHIFKVAAEFQGITPEQALMGMLTKHLVSLSDMVGSDGEFPYSVWDEKLGDAINYLVLLDALVQEVEDEPNPSMPELTETATSLADRVARSMSRSRI